MKQENSTYLISGFGNSYRAAYFSSTSTIYDSVVNDHITDCADSIVQRALGLVHDHLVTSPDKDRHSTRVGAFLDDEHLVPSRTEGYFTNNTSLAQLFGSQVFEARYDTAVGRYRNELDGFRE